MASAGGRTGPTSSTPAAVIDSHSSLDPLGEGLIQEVDVLTPAGPQSALLEDRGVRGAVLCCGGAELPLAFAKIEREEATITVTVHESVHPGCAQKGTPVAFTCNGGAADAEAWRRSIADAVGRVNGKHWGISKSFVVEQHDRWQAERERCNGMTVANYFQDIGLSDIFDQTWNWCPGVLAALEAKQQKSTADLKEISYYQRKVNKTELYEDMELTDYMNILKHQDLVPAGKQVSYADFIAGENDRSGRHKVGKATVFVSHVWKMTAKDFFEVCLAEMSEDDYAWIDLYLHNQYQGAVSSIGHENSEYWINKFGDLVGGIGRVLAIVTDWESPVMLTRIWCLFELNAAIDTGAELRFVATMAERQDLSLNLNRKFQGLGTIVSSIDVRECDAKRPHEVQDKTIFLSKLHGIEDDVNAKLQRELLRWLCEAAEGVVARTNPQRPRLDTDAMDLEKKDIGEGSWCSGGIRFMSRKNHHGCFCLCVPGIFPTQAKLTWLLEVFPWLGPVVVMLGVLTMASSMYTLGIWYLPLTTGLEGGDDMDDTWMWISCCLLFVGSPLALLGGQLKAHQERRQLRRPPPFGAWATRHAVGIRNCLYLVLVVVLPAGLGYSIGWPLGLLATLAGLIISTALATPLFGAQEAAAERAVLRAKVGWLWLQLGETEEAVKKFAEAQLELVSTIGPKNPTRRKWVVAPGYARALCEAGRHVEAENLRTQVEMEGRKKDKDGYLLRAGMAAALRKPDRDVLGLLTEAATSGCWVPAGSGGTDTIRHGTEGGLPEWDEFLGRMAGQAGAPDRVSWEAYRTATIELAQKQVAKLDGVELHVALAMRGLIVHDIVRGDTASEESKREQRTQLLASLFEHPAWIYVP